VTHLAGAVNKPLPFLLPFTPDWRWILERSDAPWYPRATLYRQTVPADLPSVIARVRGPGVEVVSPPASAIATAS
ncbi:MAG: hypothetical protein ACK58T_01960, partial [Phycisphaerae bacterium]